MSVAVETIVEAPIAMPTRPRHRISLAEYERMIKLGVYNENDRFELIRGELVTKMAIGDPHAVCVDRLMRLFVRRLDDNVALVRIQNPVVVLESRPEPDVVLATPRDDGYSTSAPRSQNILLLIEVSDSTLAYDRNEKLSLYAEGSVQEYWIANVNRQCLEVYRDPQPDGTYADRRIASLGESVNLLALPDVSVAVNHVFPAQGG